jgi:hypothetical protein
MPSGTLMMCSPVLFLAWGMLSALCLKAFVWWEMLHTGIIAHN